MGKPRRITKINVDEPKQGNEHGVSSLFSSKDMIDFGNFIRDNYYGVGAPKLISNFPSKYPHGTVEDIFVIWSCLNGSNKYVHAHLVRKIII